VSPPSVTAAIQDGWYRKLVWQECKASHRNAAAFGYHQHSILTVPFANALTLSSQRIGVKSI
jgi:hypothetical protein